MFPIWFFPVLFYFYLQISSKTFNFAPMIELGRHIEILLLNNDCVIVPGLGGFMAHHVEARHDHDEGLFLPPLRTLGFNPQLKLNDSLLAQSYIEAYDISYPEAIRRIESEVNELKQHINNDGRYEMNDIGTLYLNEENCYIFEPCEAGILTPSLYGLSSFEITKLSQEDNKDKVKINTIQKEESISGPIEEIADTEIKKYDEDISTIKIKVAWIRNAVAIAAAVIVFFFITTPISNSDANFVMGDIGSNVLFATVQRANDTSRMGSISPAQIKKAISQNSKTEKTTIDTITTSAKKTDSIQKKKIDDKPYCIVLASQITKRNAESYVNELHRNGLEEAYVYIHNNMVRVVYGKYKDDSEAYKDLRTARDNKYFEQAWVYRKR